ncbi:MAG: 3-hydroxybutyryl-CoA dehydrogenase [Paracoccaceae bacterium]|jgi:3-hydroxybutyryl-CoA dehydrogenase
MRIGVIGAGLMGHGIALIFAKGGYEVSVYDPSLESLNALETRVTDSLKVMGVHAQETNQILSLIKKSSSLEGAVKEAEIIIEAAPEKLELKQSIFAEIEFHAPANSILASNTSVIQISKIMKNLSSKHRALGTHWWNPPHLIPLVEVIRTEWTDNSVIEKMVSILSSIGKTPVRVEKDVPGFIGNRLQSALWREAISLVENGICDAEAVDTVVKESFGRRLAVLGPLENADLVGTDLTLDIHNQVLFDLEARKGPSPYLENLVNTQKLGMKSGAGFRNWTPQETEDVRIRLSEHLIKLEGILKK